jgi:uncharacterized membrane protein
MEKIFKPALLILAAVIVLAFFLPWVSIESASRVGKITEMITRKAEKITKSFSGFNVPQLANSSESELAIFILRLFNPGIKYADKKSYLIWVIPILAVIIAGAMLFLDKNKWVNLAVALLGIMIFTVALYKIKTTDLNKLILKIDIAAGLWFTLLGYLGIGSACLGNFLNLSGKKKK